MTMNEQNEKLSALMDDFHDSESDRSVLDGLLADVNQKYTLRRYQMISDVLHNEMPSRVRPDFHADVMSAIAREPSLSPRPVDRRPEPEPQPSWSWSVFFKPVAGLAVAAAVAVVAVSSLQSQFGDSAQDAQQYASNDSSSQKVEILSSLPVISNAVPVSAGSSTRQASPAGMAWKIKRNEPRMQMKLNSYLINHNEYSNSIQGIIPQVRVVGFDVQK